MIKLFKREKKKDVTLPTMIDKSFMMSMKPVRNPMIEWEKTAEGEIVIYLEKTPPKIIKKMASRKVAYKRIVLDAIGSFVWEMCDGKYTVNDIIKALMKKYKLRRLEAERSLLAFLRMLAQRKLIGLLPPKHITKSEG
ncbi:MAG: hypothetical protein DRN53_02610 [Thermoprotei archaeon]|nr:MAG: hypothetical protein DRN53_02610 [Thermoprotei archaeon]